MADWTLLELKKKVGRTCGDPDALTYPDDIKSHIVNAIESMAENIVAISDLNRSLNDEERKAYQEVIGLAESEIFPMLKDIEGTPSYSNKVGFYQFDNTIFKSMIRLRDVQVSSTQSKTYNFKKINSLREFNRIKGNPHLMPDEGEAVWFNSGNKVYIMWGSEKILSLVFSCLVSLNYSSWTDATDLLQTLGFGSNFLVAVSKRASYTMRLQIGLEKE